MTQPGITVSGVTKSFVSRGERVEALRELDLTVEPGAFVAVIGPSGCGKSTLLRLVGGLAAPDRGTIAIGGRTPEQARRDKQFGLVPQSPALLPWRTVRANIELLGEVNRSAGGASLSPVDPDLLLDAVGLRAFERALPGELSGGMQQRVSIARAFALGAPVLLMDEPFASLDEITREEMRFLLLEVWSSRAASAVPRTVLFVTHSIEEAVLLADRVVVLSGRPGKVVEEITVDLPRPRTVALEDSDAFVDHTRRVRAALRDGWAARGGTTGDRAGQHPRTPA